MSTKSRSIVPLTFAVCGWLLCLALLPAARARGAVQASWLGEVAVVSQQDGAAALGLPDGSRVALPIPREWRISSLALTEARGANALGWHLAADRPADAAGGGRELVILRGVGKRFRELAVPGWQEGRLRQGAVLLTEGDRLAGLLWLEGEDPRSLAVKAAPWQVAEGAHLREEGWGAPVTVAPEGPGSQLALTGAVLGDGSWLVAWSGYDGQDDEVLWSRRLPGTNTWSPPARLGADNAVPDITPTLAAVGDGALLAWSRYDGGQYRLFQARFEGEGFSNPEALGEPGTLHPSFHHLGADPDSVSLLYLRARPRAWGVMEMAADGTPGRWATVPIVTAAERQRPALLRFEDGVLRLTWQDSWQDSSQDSSRDVPQESRRDAGDDP